MDEKKIIKLSNEIVETLMDFSLGEGKVRSLIPGSVAKKLSSDEELFNKLKECYIDYLAKVDNKIDDTTELKRLTDFRYQLIEIYNSDKAEEMEDLADENATSED